MASNLHEEDFARRLFSSTTTLSETPIVERCDEKQPAPPLIESFLRSSPSPRVRRYGRSTDLLAQAPRYFRGGASGDLHAWQTSAGSTAHKSKFEYTRGTSGWRGGGVLSCWIILLFVPPCILSAAYGLRASRGRQGKERRNGVKERESKGAAHCPTGSAEIASRMCGPAQTRNSLSPLPQQPP